MRELLKRTKIEVRVFIARCCVTHATVERVAARRPSSLVATQRRGKYISVAVATQRLQQREMFSVRWALTKSTTEFSVRSAPRLYTATLGIFAANSLRSCRREVNAVTVLVQ
jgi:hypothetical protein